VNVTGAILASLLFFGVVFAAQRSGLTPEVVDRKVVAAGELVKLDLFRGRPVYFEVAGADGPEAFGDEPPAEARPLTWRGLFRRVLGDPPPPKADGTPRPPDPGTYTIVDVDKRATPGSAVEVTRYLLGDITHFDIRPAGTPLAPDYDQRQLPRFLFFGAAAMTLLTLLVLWRPLRRLRRDGV